MTSPDSPRVRRDLLVAAQRLTLEIDQIEDELELFRERDVPAFQAWFASRAGRESAVIRRLEAELAELTETHNAVVAHAQMHDLTMDQAYRLIEREAATFGAADAETRARIGRERGRRRAFIAADLETEFRARTRGPADPAAAVDADAVKVIYRQLARRLHPDVPAADPGDETRWRRRYWTLLQAARDRGDAPTLAGLFVATKVRQLDLRELSLAEAERAHAWLTREGDEFRAECRRARDTVAWAFTTAHPDDVERRVRDELRRDARRLREEIHQLRAEHELLKQRAPGAPPARRRARATRRPVTTVHQLSFFD